MARLRLTALALLFCAGLVAGQEPKQSLPTVTYEQLGKKVRDLTGKVVVVYFWADT